MSNVKMPERYTAHRDMITGHEFCDLYTEFQMKQYGDDRAREALEKAAIEIKVEADYSGSARRAVLTWAVGKLRELKEQIK